MKTALFSFLMFVLACGLHAQPATVPGVRMQEPPRQPTTYPPSADSLPGLASDLPRADTAKRLVPKQRYLALDHYGLLGTFRRYRVQPGQPFAFRNHSERQKYRYELMSVSDTAFTIAFQNELYDQAQPLSFPLADVRTIYMKKDIPFVNQGAYVLPAAALVFLIADFVNPRTLDGQGRFLFDRRALVPAGLLAAGGLLCYKLSYRKFTIGNRNTLKVLWTY
jgi:hypothetical protein